MDREQRCCRRFKLLFSTQWHLKVDTYLSDNSTRLTCTGTIDISLIERQRRDREAHETKSMEDEARRRLESIEEDLQTLNMQEKELLEQLAAIEGVKNEIALQIGKGEAETALS